MANDSFTKPPMLPPGKTKHHIVVLEAIHCDMPSFDFPHTIDLHPRTRPDQVAERIKDATIVIACVVPVTPGDMDQAPHLGVLAVMAVGISWVDKLDCARRGVTVTNCIAGNVDAVTEHFLGLYFAARKQIVKVHTSVTTSHEWRDKGTLNKVYWPSGPPMGCRQETLGIMGYGSLGTRIEALARAVGFGEVLISERKNAGNSAREGRVSFDEILKRASTICVCLPKENDTVDLIAEKELRAMRADALLINMARGGIVNEAALAKALREGWIAGAATDVLEIEPAWPGSGPLTPDLAKGEPEVPHLTISPHIAWFTQSTIQNYQRLLKEGVEGWVTGTLQQAPDKVHTVVVVHGGKIWR
ncbi:hypothetical protein A1O3_05710 [Capronia epimyces CBS 606.96]|uniref:Glycerate dehydrogenase n=1 Tax=Capronia epimyces CBS 606.96 TaxID=1182542 RepID=W9Y5X8_9EURO|nr:uncharacterized protein A1O3_05710 [Capronia epimyces CBS 606.96]EXJ85035.1 hypothetical protein A1O3_05710 [Capronia epimyces CBS 606.96]